MPVDGVRRSLWRALAAFRVAGLAVALVLIIKWQSIYARPLVATSVGVAMLLITVAVVVLALSGRAHRIWLVGSGRRRDRRADRPDPRRADARSVPRRDDHADHGVGRRTDHRGRSGRRGRRWPVSPGSSSTS